MFHKNKENCLTNYFWMKIIFNSIKYGSLKFEFELQYRLSCQLSFVLRTPVMFGTKKVFLFIIKQTGNDWHKICLVFVVEKTMLFENDTKCGQLKGKNNSKNFYSHNLDVKLYNY